MEPIVIRELVSISDQNLGLDLFDAIWPIPGGGREIPENLMQAFVHNGSYFSGAFSGDEILGATFLSGLVEHSTSCSLWMEETTGWVTTLCPGNASNFAWGSSGRRTGLPNATRNISNEARGPSHDMEENIGGYVVENLQF